jgi:RNA polymerase sigma-70 factor (ECF subfamily)
MLAFYLATLESDADRKLFTFIYENYRNRMEKTAIQILKHQSDAEDAVQNSFMQVIRHFEKVYSIPREELPFWLISIVKNEAFMIIRKRNRVAQFEDWEEVSAVAEDVTSYRELVELILKLPETYRAILEMKIMLGYSDKEIAKHLNISETAVSTRASRARDLLRKVIEKEGMNL